MENQYKLFNGDAALHLIHNSELQSYKNSGFYEFDTKSVLFDGKLPEQFLQGDKINYFLSDEHPEHIYKQIKKQFKYLEAAGGLVFNEADELLIIFRRGKYDLPKGKCEADEPVEATAIREVMEECGIEGLEISEPLEPTYHIYTLKGEQVLKKTHWYKMNAHRQSPTPQTEEDIEWVKWMPLNEISKFISNTYPTLKSLLQTYSYA